MMTQKKKEINMRRERKRETQTGRYRERGRERQSITSHHIPSHHKTCNKIFVSDSSRHRQHAGIGRTDFKSCIHRGYSELCTWHSHAIEISKRVMHVPAIQLSLWKRRGGKGKGGEEKGGGAEEAKNRGNKQQGSSSSKE
jgi:hypothetical protein